jgi:hypothetical protein
VRPPRSPAGADREDANNQLGAGNWFEYGTALRQTALIVEPAETGRIPAMTEEGKRRQAGMQAAGTARCSRGLKDFNSLDRCITRGMPATMLPFPYNNGVRVFQAPGWVVINHEMIHEQRFIPLDGRRSRRPATRPGSAARAGTSRATRWWSRRPTSTASRRWSSSARATAPRASRPAPR